MNTSCVEERDEKCHPPERVLGRKAEERNHQQQRTDNGQAGHETALATTQATDERTNEREMEIQNAHERANNE